MQAHNMRYMFLMRDERRKKERSKQRQTNKQGKATQHTQGSLFLGKMRLYVDNTHTLWGSSLMEEVVIKNSHRTHKTVGETMHYINCTMYHTCTVRVYTCIIHVASFPGSPSSRVIIPRMTFDPPERKADGLGNL